MFGRLIFIVALFLLVFLAFRYFRSQMIRKEQKTNGVGKSTSQSMIKEMKPCSLCGIHMQEDEMLQKGKHHFCSYRHMQDFDSKTS